MVQNIISSLGGGSGIDTLKLVDDLVALERAPKTELLDSKQQKLQSQISGYGALRSAMSGIEDAAKQLADSDTFNARNVSFPDTNLLTPTDVDAGAAPGDYTIEVLGLARSHSLSGSGFSDPDAAVGKGTLTFTFGDWAADLSSFTANAGKAVQNITIDDSNNTLSGIRDAINDADFGVQASIIESGGSYSLQLTSASGADNELQIAVTEDGAAGLSALSYEGFPPSGGLTQNQAGADSSMKVNGLTVTRDSNQITDVIDGLSFSLNQVSVANETVTVSISADKNFGEQAIRDFVDAYNEFLDQAEILTKRTTLEEDAEDRTPGSLAADPSAKSMINQVRGLISQTITGLDGSYTALATIGIQTELDGTLSINDDQLSKALSTNYKAVTDLFTGTTSSSDTGVKVVRTKAATEPGTYDVAITTQPAKGFVQGGSITDDDATALGLDKATGSFGAGLDAASGDYSFQVTVDGTKSNLITLNGNYADTDALIADLQAQINGDAKISGVGAGVDISYDAATASFTVTSRAYGSSSKVAFSGISSDMGRFALGGGATSGSLTAGGIVDAGATDLGTPGTLATTGTIVDAGATAIDTQGSLTTSGTVGAVFPFTTDGLTHTLDITVDGVATGPIALAANTYNSAADVATQLQSQINTALAGAASVTVGYDGIANKFTFTSDSAGSGSSVAVTSAGVATGTDLGITAEAGTAGQDDVFVNPLDTSLGDYSFSIAVDGAAAVNVALTGTYANAEEVRAALETQINAAGAAVTVGFDTAANRYSITSTSSGSSSAVEITAVGADMGNLGFAVEAGTAGDDETFVTPLDTTTGYTFSISVDGGAAQAVDLNGTYSTTEEVRAALQAQITGATVGYDATAKAFTFTSDATGATSDVDISAADANINNLGIVDASGTTGRDASAGTAGVNVAGTINGEEAFGSGNILLPKIGSELAGLSLEISPTATSASITIARGFSNELTNVLDNFLKNSGIIDKREDRLNDRLGDVDEERTELDRRMETYRAKLESQFLAMERIIATLNQTSSSLDGLVDRLPFTAKK